MIALLPHCGFLSEATRMLHIAQALRAQGEAVSLATHGGPYAEVLSRAGEQVTPLAPHFDRARCEVFLRNLIQIGRPGVRMQPPDEVRESVQAEAAFLRGVGARAVVSGFTLTTYLSSRLAGIPLITSHGGSYVPPVFERGLAPVPTRCRSRAPSGCHVRPSASSPTRAPCACATRLAFSTWWPPNSAWSRCPRWLR